MDISALASKFKRRFGCLPDVIARAPGRVNLIGEHIDYNGGPVLPMGIERWVHIAGRRREDRRLRLASAQFDAEFEGTLPRRRVEQPAWANYCLGVLLEFEKRYGSSPGLDLMLTSDVPVAAGLSSSAALEVATARAAAALLGLEWKPLEMALLCQRAENQFVGVNCGLMDQAAAACSRKGSLLLLDCATPACEWVPYPQDSMTVVIAHSGVRRGLSASAYNERRSQCEAALERINQVAGTDFRHLCDVPAEVFEEFSTALPDVLQRRARHVILETSRVARVVDGLQKADLASLGAAVNESHYSLRDDYEVSCVELDQLTEISRGFRGVLGSRLTGAGFGGCTVTLVLPDRASALLEHLQKEYYVPKGIEPLAFSSLPAAGAEELILC